MDLEYLAPESALDRYHTRVEHSVLAQVERVFDAHPDLRVNRDGSGRLDGQVHEAPIGAMRAIRFETVPRGSWEARGGRGRRYMYWLTPPVVQFLDAKKHLPDDVLRELGTPLDRERRYQYFIQPEVFAATGELLGGSLEATHRVFNVRDTQRVIEMMAADGDTNELGNLILVALDAFLEKNAPDARFNPQRRFR